jgi:ribonuclease HI
MFNLKVFTDGGSKGNPGPASIGGVFYFNNKKIFQFNQSIGIATNNDAEYQALIYALEEIKKQKEKLVNDFKVERIDFYSDSRLLVNQINGFFKVKNEKIKEHILKIRMLEQEINLPISYHQIPREKNKEADRLVNILSSKNYFNQNPKCH